MSILNDFLRGFYNFYMRTKLRNKTFTLVSSNCNGACMLHDLGLKFNTPFVGLLLKPADFLRLCGNLEYYLSCELTFLFDIEEVSCPVGALDDIKIYFIHYSSEEEAKSAWDTRKKRVNFQDIFLLFSDRNHCTYEMLKQFDALEYKHKIVFCNKEYPEIKSARYIPGFEDQESVGVCLDYVNRYSYKKYYDAFDFVSWFNMGGDV